MATASQMSPADSVINKLTFFAADPPPGPPRPLPQAPAPAASPAPWGGGGGGRGVRARVRSCPQLPPLKADAAASATSGAGGGRGQTAWSRASRARGSLPSTTGPHAGPSRVPRARQTRTPETKPVTPSLPESGSPRRCCQDRKSGRRSAGHSRAPTPTGPWQAGQWPSRKRQHGVGAATWPVPGFQRQVQVCGPHSRAFPR